jgi:periplasmic protein TonB
MDKLVTIIFLLLSNSLFSQPNDTTWYTKKWEKTNKTNGYYYRISKYNATNKNYTVTDYFPSGKPQMRGNCSSLEPEIKEGLFVYYYDNGNKESEAEYSMNVLIWTKKWNVDGSYESETKTALFPGGIGKLLDFISSNTKYPMKARKKEISGIVMIDFLIDASGKVDSARVTKSIHPLLDKEALRVVKSMPDWTPAETDGKKVKYYYSLPISFKLED